MPACCLHPLWELNPVSIPPQISSPTAAAPSSWRPSLSAKTTAGVGPFFSAPCMHGCPLRSYRPPFPHAHTQHAHAHQAGAPASTIFHDAPWKRRCRPSGGCSWAGSASGASTPSLGSRGKRPSRPCIASAAACQGGTRQRRWWCMSARRAASSLSERWCRRTRRWLGAGERAKARGRGSRRRRRLRAVRSFLVFDVCLTLPRSLQIIDTIVARSTTANRVKGAAATKLAVVEAKFQGVANKLITCESSLAREGRSRHWLSWRASDLSTDSARTPTSSSLHFTSNPLSHKYK